MAETPPRFGVTFRPGQQASAPQPGTYQLALDLTARVFTVVELAEVERYFLRDQLDRRSTAIPVLIAHALGTSVMHDRRALYDRARRATRDCLAVLDILSERGTVEPAALDAARSAARGLIERLDSLTIVPPMAR